MPNDISSRPPAQVPAARAKPTDDIFTLELESTLRLVPNHDGTQVKLELDLPIDAMRPRPTARMLTEWKTQRVGLPGGEPVPVNIVVKANRPFLRISHAGDTATLSHLRNLRQFDVMLAGAMGGVLTVRATNIEADLTARNLAGARRDLQQATRELAQAQERLAEFRDPAFLAVALRPRELELAESEAVLPTLEQALVEAMASLPGLLAEGEPRVLVRALPLEHGDRAALLENPSREKLAAALEAADLTTRARWVDAAHGLLGRPEPKAGFALVRLSSAQEVARSQRDNLAQWRTRNESARAPREAELTADVERARARLEALEAKVAGLAVDDNRDLLDIP